MGRARYRHGRPWQVARCRMTTLHHDRAAGSRLLPRFERASSRRVRVEQTPLRSAWNSGQAELTIRPTTVSPLRRSL
jgi:hypothetical protein